MERYEEGGYDLSGYPTMDKAEDGEWVKYSDVETLQAENKRYKEALERIAEDWEEGGWNGWKTCLALEALQQGEK